MHLKLFLCLPLIALATGSFAAEAPKPAAPPVPPPTPAAAPQGQPGIGGSIHIAGATILSNQEVTQLIDFTFRCRSDSSACYQVVSFLTQKLQEGVPKPEATPSQAAKDQAAKASAPPAKK